MNTKLDLNKSVITIDGTQAPRKHCRYIREKYYIMNKQCFKINNTWYRNNSPKIIFDHELDQYRLKDDGKYVEGIVDINSKGEFIKGFFTPNSFKNISILTGDQIYHTHPGINRNLIKQGNLQEGRNGVFYSPKIIDSELLKQLNSYRRIEGNHRIIYTIPWAYSSDPSIEVFSNNFNQYFKGKPLSNAYYKYLSYSFGLEFETKDGVIPQNYLLETGLIPCRDGSIGGFEYVTIPLKGKTGIQALYEHCSLLSHFCIQSEHESVHLHLGGYKKTEASIMGLYKILHIIQDDIYNMFPSHYRHTETFKRRSYCNPLPYITTKKEFPHNIDKLFNLLDSEYQGELPNGINHPADRSGQHKWNVNPRYKIVNLVSLIWGTRGTVEFRVHTPTTDFNKVIYWLFICSAILKYSEKYYLKYLGRTTTTMNSLSLSTIIKDVYPSDLAAIIINYIDLRTSYYVGGKDEIGLYECQDEQLNKTLAINTPNPLIKVYDNQFERRGPQKINL